MRPAFVAAVLSASILVAGCSKKRDPNATDLGSGPKLWLSFPEKPRIDTQDAGAMKIHTATLAQKRPEGVLILGAMVMENSGAAGAATTEELLEANAAALKQYETSRTSFTMGKKKHAGLDITSKVTLSTTGAPMFERKKIVVIGQNTYIANAGSTREEFLNEKAVQKFFDSFEIEE
jgi:hypothetical protein